MQLAAETVQPSGGERKWGGKKELALYEKQNTA